VDSEETLVWVVILVIFTIVICLIIADNKKFNKVQAQLRKKEAEKAAAAKAKTIAAAKAKAEEEAQVRARNALMQKYETALNFSTYELAEIVINLVDLNSYDKLKDVASVLTDPTHIDEVLSDASKMLAEGYESAIKEIATTRCADINYQEETVSKKLAALVASCVAIGRGAIGKKIGVVVGAVDSSVAKGTIRKTKKWEA